MGPTRCAGARQGDGASLYIGMRSCGPTPVMERKCYSAVTLVAWLLPWLRRLHGCVDATAAVSSHRVEVTAKRHAAGALAPCTAAPCARARVYRFSGPDLYSKDCPLQEYRDDEAAELREKEHLRTDPFPDGAARSIFLYTGCFHFRL